ncbi:hypothetical protein GCM10010495_08440 [Kitasatospora herbaricolor]|nr:hypothetical protein [Kitasatospora herbaricolor]GGV00023.1 hypothetical protein GCM10010495_08440 [Kitasatospora herbaricolor]
MRTLFVVVEPAYGTVHAGDLEHRGDVRGHPPGIPVDGHHTDFVALEVEPGEGTALRRHAPSNDSPGRRIRMRNFTRMRYGR